MKAICRRFYQEDYEKIVPTPQSKMEKFFNMAPQAATLKHDREAYEKAIADFITEQGPTRIISVVTPGYNYRWPITDVWYWEMETPKVKDPNACPYCGHPGGGRYGECSKCGNT